MGYEKISKHLRADGPGRKNFTVYGNVICHGCFEKKLLIDDLREENVRLKARLCHFTGTKGRLPDNVHTPSSKIDLKKNSEEDLRKKKGGAKQGHKGHGREAISEQTADEVLESTLAAECCPDCGQGLHYLDSRERSVIEAMPLKAKRILYRMNRYRCSGCSKVVEKKPEILPKCLYGNRLLSQGATMHYFHGVSIGRLLAMFGSNVTEGGLIQALHRLGKYCEKALPPAIDQFRKDEVRHADETGWRNDGHSGYAWLFASEHVSILEFANSRASHVPRKIFGSDPLKGTLVVDRYGGYNKMPVALQYCYAHLLREVEKLEQEFPENKEIIQFSSQLIPLLAQAMKLRGLDIIDKQYYRQAKTIRAKMKKLMRTKCSHLGIIRIQQIFTGKEHRLYHWVKDRRVPADNNRAERELRPTVIARKVSFGSQSEAGARTRSAIMTVLFTAKKRLPSEVALEDWLKGALDQIAQNPKVNIWDLLPPERAPTNPTSN